MAAMFTMMNNARLNVGLQGVGIAERATQRAVAYALERKQGLRNRLPVPIAEHPDVRRMLLRMRALTMGARALAYYAFGQVDRASRGDPAAGLRAEVLTPLAKAWGTDVGIEVASLGIQVHGGMGYIEETGAAQHLRDARIASIYEGTNGIQAADLVGPQARPRRRAGVRRADRRHRGGNAGSAAGRADRCGRGGRCQPARSGAGRPAGGQLSVPHHVLGDGRGLAGRAHGKSAGRRTSAPARRRTISWRAWCRKHWVSARPPRPARRCCTRCRRRRSPRRAGTVRRDRSRAAPCGREWSAIRWR